MIRLRLWRHSSPERKPILTRPAMLRLRPRVGTHRHLRIYDQMATSVNNTHLAQILVPAQSTGTTVPRHQRLNLMASTTTRAHERRLHLSLQCGRPCMRLQQGEDPSRRCPVHHQITARRYPHRRPAMFQRRPLLATTAGTHNTLENTSAPNVDPVSFRFVLLSSLQVCCLSSSMLHQQSSFAV